MMIRRKRLSTKPPDWDRSSRNKVAWKEHKYLCSYIGTPHLTVLRCEDDKARYTPSHRYTSVVVKYRVWWMEEVEKKKEYDDEEEQTVQSSKNKDAWRNHIYLCKYWNPNY